MMFGLVGLALYRQSRLGLLLSLAGALASGLGAVWVIRKLFAMFARLVSSGTIDSNQAEDIIASAILLLTTIVFLVPRYKRYPTDKILVIYGKLGEGQSAATLLMIEKIEGIVTLQVEAIKNLNIDKVTVWDSGRGANGQFPVGFDQEPSASPRDRQDGRSGAANLFR